MYQRFFSSRYYYMTLNKNMLGHVVVNAEVNVSIDLTTNLKESNRNPIAIQLKSKGSSLGAGKAHDFLIFHVYSGKLRVGKET